MFAKVLLAALCVVVMLATPVVSDIVPPETPGDIVPVPPMPMPIVYPPMPIVYTMAGGDVGDGSDYGSDGSDVEEPTMAPTPSPITDEFLEEASGSGSDAEETSAPTPAPITGEFLEEPKGRADFPLCVQTCVQEKDPWCANTQREWDFNCRNVAKTCATCTDEPEGEVEGEIDMTVFGAYPDYTGALAPTGEVTLEFYADAVIITYDMRDLDDRCTEAQDDVANSCGIHIHAGTSCDEASDVGGHYYDATMVETDPWTYDASYKANGGADGSAFGSLVVTHGYGYEASLGHAFVMHDYTGARVSCTIIATENCADSCPYHNDGICDDGGSGAKFASCVYGSDCGDCGDRSTGGECVDDMAWPGSLYGGCESYMPGEENYFFCDSDGGAAIYCCESCSTPPGCESEALWPGVGYGGCDTYYPGMGNHFSCDADGATDVCCDACTTEACDPAVEASWPGLGFGGCDTYQPGNFNHFLCDSDGASEICCEACSAPIGCETEDIWPGVGFGGCSEYVAGSFNHPFCDSDGATDICCEACSSV